MCVNIILNEHVCTFNVISKSPVFSIETTGPALVLIPILPSLTCTFHQNTNRGLKKRIGVYFHLKYYHNLNAVCTFNHIKKYLFYIELFSMNDFI